QVVVDECINEMLAAEGPVDVVETLSRPVPTVVICELLGVPYSDREMFQEKALITTSGRFTQEQAIEANEELSDYFRHLVEKKLDEPTNDLLSRLAHEQMLNGNLTLEQVIGYGR